MERCSPHGNLATPPFKDRDPQRNSQLYPTFLSSSSSPLSPLSNLSSLFLLSSIVTFFSSSLLSPPLIIFFLLLPLLHVFFLSSFCARLFSSPLYFFSTLRFLFTILFSSSFLVFLFSTSYNFWFFSFLISSQPLSSPHSSYPPTPPFLFTSHPLFSCLLFLILFSFVHFIPVQSFHLLHFLFPATRLPPTLFCHEQPSASLICRLSAGPCNPPGGALFLGWGTDLWPSSRLLVKADRNHRAALLLREFSETREEEEEADRQRYFTLMLERFPSGLSRGFCLKSGSVWSALPFWTLAKPFAAAAVVVVGDGLISRSFIIIRW